MVQEGSQKDIQSVVTSFNRDEKEATIEARAQQLGLPYFDFRMTEISPDVLAYVSKEEAAQGIIPIVLKNDVLAVGLADPNKKELQQIVKKLEKYVKVNPVLISWESVKDMLPKFEGIKKRVFETTEDYEIQATKTAITFKELENQINNAPLQDILGFVVRMAIDSKSSDIHIEPEKEGARIRFRIDGVLHIVGKLTGERFKYILSQIELASGMKLNVDEAQEGRLEVKLKNENISVRVETMPTLYGDDISLRIFNTEATRLSLDDLGLSESDRKILEKALARPQGMILVVGPTGAGKTSTIYAILNVLNRTEVKVITLEDPIEYALPGITQSQIHEDESFLVRLKAVLREDPDIVMLGEIRDGETADVALHAALTGHVMISTFHANNAAIALGLLKQISENNSLLAPAINLIIAQRLVRRLCEKCKEKYEPTAEEKEFAEKIFAELPEEIKTDKQLEFYTAKGCDACNKVGYTGRIGIFELLPLSVEFQKVVSRPDITAPEIQEAAKKSGMITMEQDGLLKALSGTTSISEVMKAVKE